jgi:hypothetical protein
MLTSEGVSLSVLNLIHRSAYSAEQHDVHPQPPAWPPFAFHLLDEVLAFF